MDNITENGTENLVLNETTRLGEKEFLSLEGLLRTITDTSSQQPVSDKKNAPSIFTKKGFYEVINNKPCPLSLLSELRSELKKKLDDEIANIEEIIQLHLEKFRSKIKVAEEIIDEQKEELKTIKGEIPQLFGEKKLKQAELELIQQKLFSLKNELADEKKALVDKWLSEAEKEIKKILEIKALIIDDKQKESTKVFAFNKINFNEKKSEAEKMLEYYSQRYEEVHQQMRKLGVEGMNPISARFLKWAGYTAIIAAGWFFSVFTSKTSFNNQDPFYYLFHGLLDFASYTPGNALARIFQWLGILMLIMLISFICSGLLQLMKRDKNKKGKQRKKKFEQELNTEFDIASFYYKGRLRTKSWLQFWLNIFPLLFIIGIIIIFLAFNRDNLGKVSELDSSLAGIAVGSGICIGIAATVYLYIIRIIEPRITRNTQRENFSWKNNRELPIVILLFTICTSIIIINSIFTDHYFDTSGYVIISLIEFLSIALLAGFAIGYGLRYLGLIYTSHFLEKKIAECHDNIANYSGPETVTADQAINERVNLLVGDLIGQIEGRGNLLKQGVLEKQGNTNWPSRLLRWRFFRYRNARTLPTSEVTASVNDSDGGWTLKEWEQKYFADYFTRMEAIQMVYKDKQQELSAINDRIQLLSNKQSGPTCLIIKEIELWYSRIDNWKNCIVIIYQRRNRSKNALTEDYLRREVELMEGFHLGIWYRENNMGPNSDFYTSCL